MPPRSTVTLVALQLAVLGLPAAHAGDGDASGIDRVAVRRWTTRDGLPQDTITDIAQDEHGYLWVSTFGGVARFDGVRFEVFDIAGGVGLTGNRFLSVHTDAEGILWFGSQGQGVFRYHAGRFEAPPELAPLAHATVWDIAETSGGNRWFATEEGLYQATGNALVRYTTAEGLPATQVFALHVDDADRLWIGTMNGLARFEHGRFTVLDSVWQVRTLVESPDGDVWAGAASGILRVVDDRLVPQVADDLWLNAVGWDAEGRPWVSSPGGPALLTDQGPVSLRRPPGDRPAFVRTFFLDAEGNLWVGTGGAGLLQLRDPRFTRVPLPHGLSISEVGSVVQDGEGAIWVGSACGGLGRVVGAGVEMVEPDVCVRSLAQDPSGGMWFTRDRRLVHIKAGERTEFGPASGLPDVPLLSLFFDRSGVLWVGTAGAGVLRREGDRFLPVPGVEAGTISTIAQGADGGMWFGTAVGILRLQGTTLTTLGPAEGLPAGEVRDILVDPDGVAWVATYGGGLAVVRGEGVTRYSTADGLLDNAISRILDDGAGFLWFNGNRGVFRIARSDFATGTLQPMSFSTGEASGGMPAGWRAGDGRLWFPTVDGMVNIDPANVPVPTPTWGARIQEASLGGHVLQEGAAAAPRVRDLAIRYTAPYFLDPSFLRFRYRLTGHEPDWLDGGDRRTIHYANLPPGSYRFEVQAAGPEGAWGTESATLSFRIPPRFAETRWFLLLLLVIGFALATALFQRRLRASRERQEHYRTIFEQASNGLVLHANDGSLVEANATLCRMLGLSRGALDALPPLGFVAPLSRETWRTLVRQACAGKPVEADGVHLRRGDAWFEVRVSAVPLDRGKPHALFSVIDVSEERRIEQEKRLFEDQLRVAQKLEAVGLLAGGIAHDFNNLMTVILVQAHQLERMLTGEAQEWARDIRTYGLKGARLTRQLLAFSRSQVLKPTRLDVRRFLLEHQSILRASLPEDIRLHVTSADPGPTVSVDPTQLEQALLNLLFNARDAMPSGGDLTISVEAETVNEPTGAIPSGEYVVISVCDTGVGMAADVSARIFEPFFTTKPQGQGTGLGLASVHGFVRQSGGDVRVESAPDQGTTFRLYLPAATGVPAPDPLPEAPTVAPCPRGTILVCDDEDGVARAVARILRREGHRVETVTSPLAALDRAGAEPFDLLITDVVMPDMRGTQLAVEVRERLPGVRVLFMSGHNREPSLANEPFIEKPFDADVLVARVRELLAMT